MTRRLVFSPTAWSEYLYWQSQDIKTLQRINLLIRDCLREPFSGIGKPEPLRRNLNGCWSRRINDGDRLVYRVSAQDLEIVACRYHY